MVTSPCINICRLDDNKICVGCNRTIEEITAWTKYTDKEKLEVLGKINDRINRNRS